MNTTHTTTGTTGLLVAGWIYIIAGLAFAVGSFSPAFLDLLQSLVLPDRGPAGAGVELWAGIGGGLTAGLGAMLVGVGRRLDGGPVALARALSTGVIVWFVVDSAASAGHGSWQNVLGNVDFAAIGLVPLLRLARGASTRTPIVGEARAA